MPGKSGQRRGKYSSRGKKRKGKWGSSAVVAQQPAVAPAHEPAALPEVTAPVASEPTPVAKPALARYPYIITELRRIGILAGIMVVVLVVLALVLA